MITEELEKYFKMVEFIILQEMELFGYSSFEGADKEITKELIARRFKDYVEELNQK